jgi:hypothetical protein
MWLAWEERKVNRIFTEKPEGKTLLRRPRCRWEDGIGMDLRKVGLGGGIEWIQLAHDRG